MSTVKPKAKFGLKRKLTDKRLAALKKIHIKSGNTEWIDYKDDKEVCIMESINLMMHGEDVTFGNGASDRPPCVSETIIVSMMDLNDSTNNKDRQKLKNLASAVVGTAPTLWKKAKIRVHDEDGYQRFVDTKVLYRDGANPAYQKAENLRGLLQVEDEFYESYVLDSLNYGERPTYIVLDAAKRYAKLMDGGKIGDRLRAIRLLVDPMAAFTKRDLKLLKEYKAI